MATTTTPTNTQEHVYRPQDYTQEQVNHGQRQINYALTEADRAVVDVLTMVKDALQAPPGQMRTYIKGEVYPPTVNRSAPPPLVSPGSGLDGCGRGQRCLP